MYIPPYITQASVHASGEELCVIHILCITYTYIIYKKGFNNDAILQYRLRGKRMPCMHVHEA